MGRAGRLMKDYYGKIYCINVEEWPSSIDDFSYKLVNIESTIEKTCMDESDILISYLEDLSIEQSLSTNVKCKNTSQSLIVKQLKQPDSNFLMNLKERYTGISQSNFSFSHIWGYQKTCNQNLFLVRQWKWSSRMEKYCRNY